MYIAKREKIISWLKFLFFFHFSSQKYDLNIFFFCALDANALLFHKDLK